MSDQFQLFFVERFKGRVLFNVPMKDYTSFRIGGNADVMAFPEEETDLMELMKFAYSKRFPVFFLGGGTNLLVRDGGIRGIVVNISQGLGGVSWHEEAGGDGEAQVKCVAGAGVKLSKLAGVAEERGLSGLEFATGIPGTLGGALLMNAGAYGGEMKDVVDGVEILDRKGKKGFIPASELNLSYRSSKLPEGAAIIRLHLKLKKTEAVEVKARMEEIRGKRAASASIPYPSAGSVFKNPEGESAGRLIDDAGLKGERSGGAEVSTEHANYIVNKGSATARDVLALMALIRDKVYGGEGIVLEPEIKVVGED